MTGIKWRDLSEPEFARIVDAILQRIHPKGFAPEGRGGDGGRDFTVDDNRIIYQYKFWPDGRLFSSQRRQVRSSFETAMKHNPQEWYLVIPARILDSFRSFVMELGADRGVSIEILDQAWLDDQLTRYPDLAEYFRYRSTAEYLLGADKLATRAFVRTAEDVSAHALELKKNIDAAHPDWTWDVSMIGGQQVRILRAKNDTAHETSPITISYTAMLSNPNEFEREMKFGLVQPIRLTGDQVRNFRVVGPEIVAFEGEIAALELRPIDPASPLWVASELKAVDSAARLRRAHIGRSRFVAMGTDGFTIELELAGGLAKLVLRCPKDEGASGGMEVSIEEVANHSVSDVVELGQVCQTLTAHRERMELFLSGRHCLSFTLSESGGEPLADSIVALADDLEVIERHTPHRFLFPREISRLERVGIRCTRLMLEGKAVAHPSTGDMQATFPPGGEKEVLAQFADEPRWIWSQTPDGAVEILGEQVLVGDMAWGGLVRLHPADRHRLLAADATSPEPIRFCLDAHECWRVWLPERLIGDEIVLTPWSIPGFEEPGGHDLDDPKAIF